jgi:2-keto-3-deoxy-L-rhamnonate aldolase RhmA
VPGLDLGWLGHYDLSDSLGCAERFDDPRYRAAEEQLIAAATATDKPLGRLVPGGEEARAAVARGFRCICIGHEAAVLRNALAQAFEHVRKGGMAAP